MKKILANISNLNLSFGSKSLFQNANFILREDDKIGLLGLNGSGKSSLFKLLTDQIGTEQTWFFDRPKGGLDILLIPQDLPLPKQSLDPKQYFFFFNQDLGPSWQKLEHINKELESGASDSLVEKQKQILEHLETKQAWQRLSQFENYLKYFALEPESKPVQQMSGGEKKKILLAIGLAATQKVVLWDEPTNHLDMDSIAKFEEELLHSSKTFVLISHDRHLLSKTTSKICSIQDQKILEFDGNYTAYLEHLALKEQERLRQVHRLKNKLRREQDWMNQGIKARGTRSKKRVDGFNDLKKTISDLKAKESQKLQLSIASSNKKTKKLLEFKQARLERDRVLIENLNLLLWKGEKIGLIGENGSGKSSLLKSLLGDLPLSAGELQIAEGLKIEYFDQNREELNPESTPFAYLGEGQDHLLLPGGRTQHIAGYFTGFMFQKDDLHRPIRTLSGGEKNRLQLAKFLTKEADLWLFDEPTNDLDLKTLEVLEQTLLTFSGSFIMISHDRSFLENITSSIWYLRERELTAFSAGYADVQTFLELESLEQDLLDDEPAQGAPSPASQPKTEKRRLSNKEKSRLKELPGLIEGLEQQLEELQKQVEGFDFSTAGQEESRQYQALCEQTGDIEGQLLEYYEELDRLEA